MRIFIGSEWHVFDAFPPKGYPKGMDISLSIKQNGGVGYSQNCREYPSQQVVSIGGG